MEALRKNLVNIALSNKVSNAYLFIGENSTDCLSITLFFAAAIMCLSEDKPCGKCINCKKIHSNTHPDIIMIDLKKEKQTIGIDQIREALESVNIKANEANCKIYIIKQAHSLTVQAQNALLKTLEEPPKNTYFFLITNSKAAMLSTVKSRCQAITIPNSKFTNSQHIESTQMFFDTLLSGNKYEFLLPINRSIKDRKKLQTDAQNIMEFSIYLISAKTKTTETQIEAIEELKNKITNKALVNIFEYAYSLEQQIINNSNIQIALANFYLKCWEEIH